FMKSLDFFVREQGGGFLMAGGKRSFGSGGYFESPIDPLLPVSMELKNEHRKLSVALAIVLDRSGSMSVNVDPKTTKMDLANSGAVNAVDLLGPMDQVTVFAVDSEPNTFVKLQKVGNNKPKITQDIRRIKSSGGGIYVYTGLKAAWEALRESTAGTRHVILFSDASDSEEPGDYRNLINEMTKGGCTISVIGLGTNADPDAKFIEDVAKLGNGRIFFSDRPVDIPKIFAQETVTIARSAFLTDPVGTKPTGRWSEISPKPLQWPAQVDGYNLSYPRPDATVSLAATDEYLGPLVAHARRGLGRTAAVSFPLGGEHSESVRSWPGYGDFIQTLGRFIMGESTPPGIAIRHRVDGTRLTIDLLYDEAAWGSKLTALPPKVRLQDDSGAPPFDLPWRRIAPGQFSLTRDLDEGSVVRGAVQVGEHALAFGPINVGSSVEWSFDPIRLTELRSISAQTGGRELVDLSKAWLRPPFIAETTFRLPIGIALVILIIAEALLTRTGWKLPQLALPQRATVPSTPKVKPAKPVKAVAQPGTPEPITPATPDLPPDPEESARRSRFQRAKDRK
ncbi:MAG TPA: VWA domain-containing protein, partial [Luteolibacter sp.]|nr:VWA domain-containing protein [Luteolibacter sp.]